MSTEGRWGRINAVLNLVIIILLAWAAVQWRRDRRDEAQLREQIRRIDERLERHIATGTAQQGKTDWPSTAGGQDGL